MIDWATDVIDRVGYLGVALLIALESIVPPIPSELVLLLTGFNVSTDRFGLVGAVLAATAGSVVGALVLYGVGRWIGEDRMERLLAWATRWLGFKRADIDRAFDWFERHEGPAVLVGRFVPVVRSLVSIPAGGARMPVGRFVAFTSIGSLVWNAVWIGVGRQLGDQWEKAERWSEAIELVLLAVAAVGLVVLVVRQRRKSRSEAV
jgi:membrane protein DedA with SNARE-associated domain